MMLYETRGGPKPDSRCLWLRDLNASGRCFVHIHCHSGQTGQLSVSYRVARIDRCSPKHVRAAGYWFSRLNGSCLARVILPANPDGDAEEIGRLMRAARLQLIDWEALPDDVLADVEAAILRGGQ